MSMMRKNGPGDYQIGIWAIERQGKAWLAVATGPGTIGDGSPQKFPSLRAAYQQLTGEPRNLKESPAMATVPDRYTEGHVQRRIDQLRCGDLVNLEGDPIADPDGGDSHPEFEFEFEVVMATERETDDCIRVDFESGFSCGFPPDHWVDVDGEQVRATSL